MKLGTNTNKKRKQLIKACDDLVSKIVRVREPYCVVCGSRERLQCGHLVTRGCAIIRFDLTNCNTQCSSCNLVHEYRPERYTEWWIRKYGLEAYECLVAQSKQTKKWTIAELEVLKVQLQDILEDL